MRFSFRPQLATSDDTRVQPRLAQPRPNCPVTAITPAPRTDSGAAASCPPFGSSMASDPSDTVAAGDAARPRIYNQTAEGEITILRSLLHADSTWTEPWWCGGCCTRSTLKGVTGWKL